MTAGTGGTSQHNMTGIIFHSVGAPVYSIPARYTHSPVSWLTGAPVCSIPVLAVTGASWAGWCLLTAPCTVLTAAAASAASTPAD